MKKSVMLVANPNSGKGGFKTHAGEILEAFSAAEWLPIVYLTHYRAHATALVRDHAHEFDTVVCVGGDGTLAEVAAGMMQAQSRCPIGYIPLGTTNDVARTIGISARPGEAAKQATNGNCIDFDIGLFGENNYFTYISAFGAFTEVSYATPQEAKRAFGHMAYMLEGIRSLPTITPHHAVVEHDGGTVEGDFIFGAVTNSTSVAGLVKLDSDNVDLADGKFEVVLIRYPRDIIDFNSIMTSIISGRLDGPDVVFIKSRRVHFTFDEPVAWTRDGEDGGKHTEVEIVNCHPGVQIIV